MGAEAEAEAEAIEIAGDRGGRSVRELVDLLSKLNPSAEEFVPSSRSSHGGGGGGGGRRTTRSGGAISAEAAPAPAPAFTAPRDYYAAQMINAWFPDAAAMTDGGLIDWGLRDQYSRRRKHSYGDRKRRSSVSSTQKAQREDSIKRTIYISKIDQLITEEQLAALFSTCGKVIDCRICGDANSALRFAFVEFASESKSAYRLRCSPEKADLGASLAQLQLENSLFSSSVQSSNKRLLN